jgi:NAD(P)-dependent dehydrogenase (short-subunit alcohol dehydrogenase family)
MKINYALILGASSGFGKAISIALAKDGVNILGVHLDRTSTMPIVEDTISRIEAAGVEAHYFNFNAADANRRKEILDTIEQIFSTKDDPTIKVLVHSLAFGTLRNFIDEDPDKEIKQKQMEMTIDVMANSLVYWTQDLVRRNLMKHGSKIFALTSSGGSKVTRYYGAVSAAKSCLESHIRQLAIELAKKGISANAILAGVTNTPALRKIPNYEKIIQVALDRNPQERLTTPEDIAGFIIDIYKDNLTWMTGNVIRVDGGENIVEL